jgi:chaperonin GroES
MKIQPAFDRIIVKMDEEKIEKTTNTGLIITTPEEGNKPLAATVMAIGPGRYLEALGVYKPMSVEVGDRILMPQYGGIAVDYDDDECLLFAEVEVLGKIEE